MEKHWTHGPGTDIRLKWPACSFWEKAENQSSEQLQLQLQQQLDAVMHVIQQSEFDLSPCMGCRKILVCIPDGMPLCSECFRKVVSDYEEGEVMQ